MLQEDMRRLQREADIYHATRGPDYSIRDGDVARVKAEYRKRTEAQNETRRREQRRQSDGSALPTGNPEAEQRRAYGEQQRIKALEAAKRKDEREGRGR